MGYGRKACKPSASGLSKAKKEGQAEMRLNFSKDELKCGPRWSVEGCVLQSRVGLARRSWVVRRMVNL